MRIVEQDRLALHATALYFYLCVVYRKEATSASASIIYMDDAQPGRIPWGQASAVVSAWDAYTQPLDRTMMKGAKLEIKMNFHAGMPLVYI